MELHRVFVSRMDDLLGADAAPLLESLGTEAPVSVRLNPAKPVTGVFIDIQAAGVPWSSHGLYLKERPSFTFDPLFHAGCYYVQEAASMFVEQAFRVTVERMGDSTEPLTVLDLCAAPGGKSTLLLSMLPENGLLVANEVVRNRASVLVETIRKWGCPNAVVTHNTPSDFGKLGPVFDIMLVDAPCSGEGMFRKDQEAISEWSPHRVDFCAARQRDILANSLDALKPGGFLLYSTCTYNTEENEGTVAWLQETYGLEPVGIPVDEHWGVTGSLDKSHSDLPVYRFLPHKTKGEGFFLCLLRKPKGGHAAQKEQQTGRNRKQPPDLVKVPEPVKAMLINPVLWKWSFTPKGQLFALPSALCGMYDRLEAGLRVLHAGVMLGEMKGTSYIPHPALALSVALNPDAVIRCDASYEMAVSYLQGEALVLPVDCPSGWVLLCYKGQALGWVKNLGSRANNAWPAEWRIRSRKPI